MPGPDPQGTARGACARARAVGHVREARGVELGLGARAPVPERSRRRPGGSCLPARRGAPELADRDVDRAVVCPFAYSTAVARPRPARRPAPWPTRSPRAPRSWRRRGERPRERARSSFTILMVPPSLAPRPPQEQVPPPRRPCRGRSRPRRRPARSRAPWTCAPRSCAPARRAARCRRDAHMTAPAPPTLQPPGASLPRVPAERRGRRP